MYKITILKFRDLENSKQEHKTSRGTRASHSIDIVDEIKFSTKEDLNRFIQRNYAPIEYDENNESYISGIPEDQWSEPECPEHYDILIQEVTYRAIGPEEL